MKSTFLEEIEKAHREHPFRYDFRDWADRFLGQALAVLFPHFAKDINSPVEEQMKTLDGLLEEALSALKATSFTPKPQVKEAFCEKLPEIYRLLQKDAAAAYANDPAAESVDEVIYAYPGFYAIAVHRIAHAMYVANVPFLPRLLSEKAHSLTGIDIHPGARIGESFFIDHGTGIVIGETAEIRDRVKIYQGATLGAHSVHKRLAGVKRHPTIEEGVVIYAHATILGGKTVIGKGSIIGANCWVTESVPPNSIVTHRSTVHLANEQRSYELVDFNI